MPSPALDDMPAAKLVATIRNDARQHLLRDWFEGRGDHQDFYDQLENRVCARLWNTAAETLGLDDQACLTFVVLVDEWTGTIGELAQASRTL